MDGEKGFIRDFRKRLRVLEREIGLTLETETGCCGVTLAQCHLLLEIEGTSHTSITELAGTLELDKSTLSRTVDGLCRAGYVNRETDPDNRRTQIITLTTEGKAKADAINRRCDEAYCCLFDYIPEDRHQTVIEGITLLAGAMARKRKDPHQCHSGCCNPEGEE